MTAYPPPGRTALYRLFDAQSRLLYVGISNRPELRFVQHSYTKPWWAEVAEKTSEWFDSRAAAHDAELVAISNECPAYNKLGATGSTPVANLPEGWATLKAARNNLTELMKRSCYLGSVTQLVHRGRRVAVIVPVDYYDRAERAFSLLATRNDPEEPDTGR